MYVSIENIIEHKYVGGSRHAIERGMAINSQELCNVYSKSTSLQTSSDTCWTSEKSDDKASCLWS